MCENLGSRDVDKAAESAGLSVFTAGDPNMDGNPAKNEFCDARRDGIVGPEPCGRVLIG